MGDHVDTLLHLGLLDQLAVRAHSVLGEVLRELVADERGRVQTGQGDELPAVTQLAQALDVRLLLVARHRLLPVEGRRQVVGQLLLRPDRVDSVRKFLRLLIVGELALHPDQVGERPVRNGAVDGALRASLVPVETFPGTRGVPVPVDVHAGDALGDGAGFAVALPLGLLQVLVDEGLLVDVGSGVDGVDDSLVEQLETGLGDPLVFDGLEHITVLAGPFGGNHQIVKGLEVRVGGANDEGVVAGVNVGGDEGGGFGVGSSNRKEVGALAG